MEDWKYGSLEVSAVIDYPSTVNRQPSTDVSLCLNELVWIFH
jgi:hypothetical protein